MAWLGMFDDGRLAPWWHQLVVRYPDRFVLAFAASRIADWDFGYTAAVGYWRRALGELPPAVADALAHGNAERLWKLPASRPDR